MDIFDNLEDISEHLPKNTLKINDYANIELPDMDFFNKYEKQIRNSSDFVIPKEKRLTLTEKHNFIKQIGNLIHLNISEASMKLGMSTSKFKVHLRKNQIFAWPRRQFLLICELHRFRHFFNEDEMTFMKSLKREEYIFSKISFPNSIILKYKNARKKELKEMNR